MNKLVREYRPSRAMQRVLKSDGLVRMRDFVALTDKDLAYLDLAVSIPQDWMKKPIITEQKS